MIDKELRIVDLDGTIADHRDRSHVLQAKDFDEYHSRGRLSPAINHHIVDISDYIIVTGRDNKYRSDTWDWLEEHFGNNLPITLLMRPTDNYQSNVELKRAWIDMIERLFPDRHFVFYDDNAAVLEMYFALKYKECFLSVCKEHISPYVLRYR